MPSQCVDFQLLNPVLADGQPADSRMPSKCRAHPGTLCFRAQIIRDSSPDLPTLLDDYREYGGVCVFETIFG